jgi:hypothetical protein
VSKYYFANESQTLKKDYEYYNENITECGVYYCDDWC